MLPDFRGLSYKDRLSRYHLQSLFARRLYFDLVCVYKIIHGLIDVDPSSFFDFNSDPHTRGHKFKIKSFCSRLDVRNHWFASRIVPHWNGLPATVINSSSVGRFKSALWRHFSEIGIT